jgi:hypothetical protein
MIIKTLNTIKRSLKLLSITIFLTICVNSTFAQLTITATQAINFGAICLAGANGTVTVGYDGARTSTGSLVLLSMAPIAQPAIYEIKLCPVGYVNIQYDATTILTGSNGGELTCDIGPTEKGISGASFASNSDCNFAMQLLVGGTLHILDLTIPGTYTGTFSITFNQE